MPMAAPTKGRLGLVVAWEVVVVEVAIRKR